MGDKALQKQFTEAYDTYADALFRFCYYKTSDREVSKDIVQETYMKVWAYWTAGNTIRMVRPFLYQIAGNLVIDWYRKHKSESLDKLMEQGFDPSDAKTNSEDRAELQWALANLNKLPEADRDLIVWRYVENLSPREIGDILGEKENTISVRVHRALERLRNILQP